MLKDMETKGISAMKMEKEIFASYSVWVDDRSTDLEQEITTATSRIEQLVAFIDKAESDVSLLGSEMSKLDGELNEASANKASLAKQREAEHAEFLEAQQDYSDSVDALERAIQTLKAQAYDRPQAELLLQKMAGKVKGMRRVLAAFLEEKDVQARGAPAVAAYGFQSDSIVALLEKLLKKFKSELNDLESSESNSAHAHDLEALHLSNIEAEVSANHEQKAAIKGKKSAESAQAKGELESLRASLAADKKLLAETKSTFAMKKQAFETNQKIRAEEVDALKEATAIISDSSVSGSYAKHVKLVQTAARGTSFLQEASSASSQSTARTRAAALLRSHAEALASNVLRTAAGDVATGPFSKVIEMIEGLLERLREEAASEATHKAFCDEELHKNKLTREDHSSKVEQLQAEVGELIASIQTMSEEMATLSEEQAAVSKAMSEATDARQKEKATNEATIKDSEEAQQALKKAVTILREFYSKQSAPEASLAQKSAQVPEMEAYKGLQGSKGGVVGMLEVIQSDFLRLETETKAAESQAASEYNTLMKDSRTAQKEKHDSEFKLSLAKDQAEFELNNRKKELGLDEKALEAAVKYYESLKPQCLTVHVAYEDRVARRKEEIEALKEAYKILNGEATA